MSAESRWDRPCELCEEQASVFAEGDHGYCRAHWDELWAWRTAELKAATEAAGGPFPQTCPQQRTEFIRLYNDKTMKVGYPGHFYSPPFFCRSAAEDAHGVG